MKRSHYNLKKINEMEDKELKEFGLRQIENFKNLPKEKKSFIRQFRKKTN